jgi:ribosomal protein L18E
VLDAYRKIAEITQRQGVEAHRMMLDRVARLQRGDDMSIVPGHVHKAEINTRLGH